jgi:uncharacterized membrane protein YtjA (UPF0391 family)
MIGWALTFLLVALVAAVFGFGGIAGTAVEIAKLIFFVAIVLFAISAVVACCGDVRRQSEWLNQTAERCPAALGRIQKHKVRGARRLSALLFRR